MNIFDSNLSPMEKTIYCERYVNNGSPSGFTFMHSTSVGTRAFDNEPNIKLPVIDFKSTEKLNFYGANLNFIDNNQLIVHPDMLSLVSNDKDVININYINAIPMASHRTVFVPKFNKYIKLQYNGLIGRIERFITYDHINHSIAVNKILNKVSWVDTSLHFFPEEHARIYKQNTCNSIGMIVRDTNVVPSCKGIIIPAFSLFSRDRNFPQDKSILLQLIDKTTMNKNEFVLSQIIQPAVLLYFKILLETGLHIEAHAQNICYIITNSNIDIAIRDFESMDKDLEIASCFNDKFNINFKCIDKESQDYSKRHSFMFDFKLGEYLITPILNEAIKADCNIEYIINQIKRTVNFYIKLLPHDYFPKNCWYSYPKQLIDRTSTNRPYIKHLYPKYR